MSLTIRLAEPEDFISVLALWQGCGLIQTHSQTIAEYKFTMTDLCSAVLIGQIEDGRIVSSIMVGHESNRGWFHYAAVSLSHRRNGFGRQMIQAGETWLHRRGISKVHLVLRLYRTEPLGFFEHFGFQVTPCLFMTGAISQTTSI